MSSRRVEAGMEIVARSRAEPAATPSAGLGWRRNQSNEILVLLRKRGPLFREGRGALRTENKGSRLSGMDRRRRPPHDRRTWHPLVPRRRPDARPGRPRNTRLHQSRARKQAVTCKPPIHLNPAKHSRYRKQAVTRKRPIHPPSPPMPRSDVAQASGDPC